MSCGCGCCPKCGCRATCTCNQNIWTLESGGDFSYIGMNTVAGEVDEQYNFNGDNEYSSQSDNSDAGENGGKRHSHFLENSLKLDLGIHS
ncbi:hypothetical protein M758_12G030900 [Ceratodon purpureus]|nr:hypothetical protein M758_12G030900 [Ceratodon purpureus]